MTISKKKATIAVAALATTATIGLWAASSMAQNAAGPFTQAQADAGHNAYVTNCQVCHGETMSGGGEAPAIAGRGFMVTFGTHTTKELFDTLKAEMPFGAAGSLPDATYNNLVAFILHANGARAGTTALTPTTAVRISTVANGTVAADVSAGLKSIQLAQAAPAAPAAAAPAGAAAAGARGGAAAAGGDEGGNGNAAAAARAGLPRAEGAGGGFRINTNLGVIKAGTVPNYQNVTDAMLTNPSAND